MHLDCCFQPVGKGHALLYPGGFKNEEDVQFLIDYFGSENIIELDREEVYEMSSNVFSISSNVIVSDKRFLRLNKELRKRGFTVEEIEYKCFGGEKKIIYPWKPNSTKTTLKPNEYFYTNVSYTQLRAKENKANIV